MDACFRTYRITLGQKTLLKATEMTKAHLANLAKSLNDKNVVIEELYNGEWSRVIL